MCRVVIQDARDVIVPEWVDGLRSFSHWVESDEFPDEGRIDFLAGEIWIDMSDEKVWSHNQVKLAYFSVLDLLVRKTRKGRFFPDGLRIVHPEAKLSAVPDGVFVLNESIQTMRVSFLPAADGEDLTVQGSPDMTLEVLSNSSVKKDLEVLRQLYWKAGIPEYWLVDARGESLMFDILRHGAKGYVATRKQDGWMKSAVFGQSFRLIQEKDGLGHPLFTLEVR
jgi:Uma2 family endonuclease